MKRLARSVQAMVRRHPAAEDTALALGFAGAGLVSIATIYDEIRSFDPAFDPPATAAVALSMLGMTLPLAWRRRFPLLVLCVVVAAFLVGRVVFDIQEPAVTVLAVWVAIYSAALHGQPRFRTSVLTLCLAAFLVEVVRELYFTPFAADLQPLTQIFNLAYNVVILALPWMLGAAIRSSRERERQLADRATELQRQREENARQAVFAERVRIARELHDVVAHHVSVMGVQAGAARRVMARQPDKAIESLNSIEATSRQAVLELQRLLGFMRRSGETDELAPQSGLARLDELGAQAATGPLMVDIAIEGVPRPLSPTLDVSAYRIIQEALTNTMKHSGGGRAIVRVRYGATALEVEVLDDGAAPAAPQAGDGGHGLIGMRERASLHGGHFQAGPRPEGGFAVRATFPLNGPES